MPNIPDSGLPEGILPRLIKTLVQRRRAVKSLMKQVNLNSAEYKQVCAFINQSQINIYFWVFCYCFGEIYGVIWERGGSFLKKKQDERHQFC